VQTPAGPTPEALKVPAMHGWSTRRRVDVVAGTSTAVGPAAASTLGLGLGLALAAWPPPPPRVPGRARAAAAVGPAWAGGSPAATVGAQSQPRTASSRNTTSKNDELNWPALLLNAGFFLELEEPVTAHRRTAVRAERFFRQLLATGRLQEHR